MHGHINLIVKRALADGYELWDVLQAACVNPQKHYHQNWGLLQAGDPATFITVDNITPHFRVESTVIRGEEVFNYNAVLHSSHSVHDDKMEDHFPNNFAASPITKDDIAMDIKSGDTVHVIHASDGSLLTAHDVVKVTGNPLFDSQYPWTEVQKIIVYNRYVAGARPVVGLVRGFNIKEGAIAASVAHDCHNIVAIGSSDEYMVRAVNRIVEMRGGQVVVTPEEIMDIPLPIAGLMAPMDGHEIAFRTLCIQEKVKEIGCQMKSPFITMAFMCLPVIPDIKITDRHLIDTKTFSTIY